MMQSYTSDGTRVDDDGTMENWAILEKDASDVASLLSEPSESPMNYFATDDASSDGGFFGVSPVRRSVASTSTAVNSPIAQLELLVPEQHASSTSIEDVHHEFAPHPQDLDTTFSRFEGAQEELEIEAENSLIAASQHHIDAAVDTNERSWSDWEETERKAQDIKLASAPMPNVIAHESHRYQKILVVGESGIGKTTFISNLFAPYSNCGDLAVADIPAANAVELFEKTPEALCSEATVFLETTRTKYHYIVQDTPGIDLTDSVDAIVDYVEEQNLKYLTIEQDLNRTVKMADVVDPRVDICLYFVTPHSLKQRDVEFIQELAQSVPVLPLLAKADSMTAEELAAFRETVRAALQGSGEAGSPSYVYEFDPEALRAANCQRLVPPFAIISSQTMDLSIGQFWPVRRYPWGTCEAHGSTHSDVLVLRRLLFDTAYEDLKDATEKRYYTYREACLAGGSTLAERCMSITRVPAVQNVSSRRDRGNNITISRNGKKTRSNVANSAASTLMSLLVALPMIFFALYGAVDIAFRLGMPSPYQKVLRVYEEREQSLVRTLEGMDRRLQNATQDAASTLDMPGSLLHSGRCKRSLSAVQHTLDSTHQTVQELLAAFQPGAGRSTPAASKPEPVEQLVAQESTCPTIPSDAAAETAAEPKARTGPAVPVHVEVVSVEAEEAPKKAEPRGGSADGAARRAKFLDERAKGGAAKEAGGLQPTEEPAGSKRDEKTKEGAGLSGKATKDAKATKEATAKAEKLAKRKAKAAAWAAKRAKAQAWLAKKAAKLARSAEKLQAKTAEKLQHSKLAAWAREGMAGVSERMHETGKKLTLRRLARLAARGVFVGAWI